jgi:hypothetical protein
MIRPLHPLDLEPAAPPPDPHAAKLKEIAAAKLDEIARALCATLDAIDAERKLRRIDYATWTRRKIAAYGKARRARNTLLGRCINDTKKPTHKAPLADELRCVDCKIVHRKSRGL